MEKYKLDTTDTIEIDGHTLYRIIALIDYPRFFHSGQKGGYVESLANLSHEGYCWIYDDAKVYGESRIANNSYVSGNSIIYNSIINAGTCVRNNAKIEYSTINGGIIAHNVEISNSYIEQGEILDNAIIKNSTIRYCIVDDQAVITNSSIEKCRIHNTVKINNSTTLLNVYIVGDTIINSDKDYIIFKNNFSSFRFFLWTKSNNMWSVGCFYGTGKELIEKAYEDSDEKGKYYKAYVDFVETLKQL